MFTPCWCVQDAVQQGWFKTSRSPISGRADLRTVAMTALEVASAMTFLHSKGIVHGVRLAFLTCGHYQCIHLLMHRGHDCHEGCLGYDLPP